MAVSPKWREAVLRSNNKPAKGAGWGGPARGSGGDGVLKPFDGTSPEWINGMACKMNSDPETQAYRADRRKRVREFRAFSEQVQVGVITEALKAKEKNLDLLSRAAERLAGRLPTEPSLEDAEPLTINYGPSLAEILADAPDRARITDDSKAATVEET